MEKNAVISPCGKYRYSLSRIWDERKDKVLFIMLNPSTADGTVDDPTIRRCIQFAKDWNYGGLYVGNLYALRATNPQELLKADDPVGPDNEKHLLSLFDKSHLTVAAWGNPPLVSQYGLIEKLKTGGLYYLDLTKSGNPKHPLRLSSGLKPREWV